MIFDEIGDPFDGTTAKGFAADLKKLGNVNELNVFINSPGGSVFDGVAIFNQLKRHRARVAVHIEAMAASIASVIAMAGDEINIAANGIMMIHDPMGVTFGTADAMRHAAAVLDKVGGVILDTYVARTAGDAADISAMMAQETWMTAQEAVDQGFADEIGAELAIAAKFDLSKFKNAPEALLREAMAEPGIDDGGDGSPPIDPRLAEVRANNTRLGLV